MPAVQWFPWRESLRGPFVRCAGGQATKAHVDRTVSRPPAISCAYPAEHGAGGDGPQRTLCGRRESVPCGPRLSLGVRLLYRLSFTSHCFCPRICVIDVEDIQCRPKPLTYTRLRPTCRAIIVSDCRHRDYPHGRQYPPGAYRIHGGSPTTRRRFTPGAIWTSEDFDDPLPDNSGQAPHEGAPGYARVHLVG